MRREGERDLRRRNAKRNQQNLCFMSLYLSRGKERRERATESGRGADEARARRTVEDRASFSLTFNGRTDGRVYYHIARIGTRSSLVSFPSSSAPRSVARASLIDVNASGRTSRTRASSLSASTALSVSRWPYPGTHLTTRLRRPRGDRPQIFVSSVRRRPCLHLELSRPDDDERHPSPRRSP